MINPPPLNPCRAQLAGGAEAPRAELIRHSTGPWLCFDGRSWNGGLRHRRRA